MAEAWQWPSSSAPATAAQGSIVLVPGIQRSTPEFRQALAQMAARHGWDLDGIAIAISLESGFDPAAVNAKSGATGLIQWIPKTAEAYGTTTAELKRMSDVEQVPYIERFFTALLGSGSTPSPTPLSYDYLLLIYTGNSKLVGADPDTVISSTGEYTDPGQKTTIRSLWQRAAAQEAKAGGKRIDLGTPAIHPFPQPSGSKVSGGLWMGVGLLGLVGAIFWKTIHGVKGVRHA